MLPISEHQYEYARQVMQRLEAAGIRAEFDDRNEKIGYKIREAQLEKVPYMLVVGDKEVQNRTVSVRSRREGDKGAMPLEDMIKVLLKEVETKAL